MWGEMWSVKFSLKMPDFHVEFRDILHASKSKTRDPQILLPYGKEGVLRILFIAPEKSNWLRQGLNPRNLGSKGRQDTSRQLKPIAL
jgi:hypothetical protein